jgi:glycosyltransferase involved in cell wall biosynthesis
MRVVIIAPPWVPVPPPAYGGTEAVLDALARGLQAAGDDVLLVATGDSTCPVPTASTFARAVGVGTAGVPAEIAHALYGYAEAARFGADIVHDHTLVGPLYAAQRARVPVVTTNHGPFAGDLEPLYRAIGGRVPIIAISRDQASRAGNIPIAATIHHGVPIADYPVGDGAGDFAVFLGRMHPDKGVERACEIAMKADVRLLVAAKMSEPAERAYFHERVEPLLGDVVEYVGEVDAQQKVELLGAARCLLNPITWHEPFGMVMIEALACGTPVVARAMGAAPEIVIDGVTGAVGVDDDDLAAALKDVDSFSRDRCRQDVESRFSAERMVAAHRQLYERVLGGVTHAATKILRPSLSSAAN